jgi:hypothetical protein
LIRDDLLRGELREERHRHEAPGAPSAAFPDAIAKLCVWSAKVPRLDRIGERETAPARNRICRQIVDIADSPL